MLPPWWVSLSICHKSYCSLLSHLEYVPLSKQLLANMTSPIKLEVNRVDRRTEQQIWCRLETMLQRYAHGQTNTQTNEHTCSSQYSTPVPGADVIIYFLMVFRSLQSGSCSALATDCDFVTSPPWYKLHPSQPLPTDNLSVSLKTCVFLFQVNNIIRFI